MLCPKCGTENTEQADFCTHCAEPLKAVNVQYENVASQQAEGSRETGSDTVTVSRNEEYDASISDESQSRPPRLTNIDFQSEKQASEKPAVSPGLNIGIIIGTLIFPIIGIAMGFTYMRKPHPDAKKAGKTWLILGAIMLLINILIVSLD
ncbi:MAG: zinc-ribbon domain-containing protein [Burkholderiales bacterium]|nr:zinc-ribbon domain-containing protein [Nitrosomonas sp.]MCP5275044.1 zinc-ribbon domain-containing protein [Burkholderiales bacterium]